MKRRPAKLARSTRLLAFWLLMLLLQPLQAAPEQAPHTAFYYGAEPPAELLMQFDRVVVEAAQLGAEERAAIRRHGARLYAYFSVGEAEPWRPDYADFDPTWRLGRNEAWQSEAADLAAEGYRDWLWRRAEALLEQGYDGLFLDALDSYLPFTEGAARAAQSAGLANFIRRLKREHPETSLIANRGFEVIDRIAPQLDGLVAESLFAAYEPRSDNYRPVPEEDRDWLLARLREVRQRHALPITVIDYLADRRGAEADTVVAQIAAEGFTPWIAHGHHERMGRGLLQAVPRRVLMLYDGQDSAGQPIDISDTRVHRLLALPLEYMGYVPEYLDLRQGLPRGPLADRYAGVVSWFDHPPRTEFGLRRWLLRQIEEGLPLAVFGQWGIPHDGLLLRATGLPLPLDGPAGPIRFAHRDELIGFEMSPVLTGAALAGYPDGLDGITAHLQLEGDRGLIASGVITADWGGVALDPWVLYEDYRGRSRWLIDPFAFLRRALKLPQIPAPDVTTENGRRLLLAHIDGDGFPSLALQPGTPYAAEIIEREILRRYRLPHTVSVIEGEISRDGPFAEDSAELEAIARRILSDPLVEPASHTYSHPFRWGDLREGEVQPAGYNLPLPDYPFSFERELGGSLDYVSQQLLGGRREAGMLLLTGDCRPPERALALIAERGAIAFNGGDNDLAPDFASLTQLSPMARPVGQQLQVYAPLPNENVYTDGWQAPYDGYRRVLHTLRYTESPRRLKPINLYYHFYSGSQPAALNALREAYDWSLAQQPRPLHLREYAAAVADFRRLGIARLGDRWRVTGAGAMRSLRLPAGQRVELGRSAGIAGERCIEDGCRVHLAGDARVSLQTANSERSPAQPALRQSNGGLSYWRATPYGAEFRLRGWQPLEAEFHTAGRRCELRLGQRRLKPASVAGDRALFQLGVEDSGDAALDCR